jgi:probable rRNA maturation factor
MRNESVVVEIIDHQKEMEVSDDALRQLCLAAESIWPVLKSYQCEKHHLDQLHVLEVAFVSAAESDRIHREFMDIPGETDVITFLHGELIICPLVAKQQAQEHGEPVWRELLRYIIHGMLHLAGYQDDQENLRKAMEQVQEELVAVAWENSDFFMESAKNEEK